jgi:hypothetical protein
VRRIDAWVRRRLSISCFASPVAAALEYAADARFMFHPSRVTSPEFYA